MALRSTRAGGAALACLFGVLAACGSSGPAPAAAPDGKSAPDSPLVALQPGAWFDAQGNLAVVSAGRRLRLMLSAPIAACNVGAQAGGDAAELSTRVSLPFHVVSEACRPAHPSILLAEESETASPAELERSYHEVAHCAATDWGLIEGWVPKLVDDSDPCPLALGLGWHLPSVDQLQGLTLDDRKAVAGALFDTEDRTASAGLLLYARGAGGLALVTLSPNAAEQAPALTDEKRGKPLFGAALRCTRDVSAAMDVHAPPPVLPHATECLQAQRHQEGLGVKEPSAPAPPEIEKLRALLTVMRHTKLQRGSADQLPELSRLLATPAIEQAARDAREERALTERYAELAEGLDDPSVSESERERRHTEFNNLRKRLGSQLVLKAEGGTASAQLAALLVELERLLEDAASRNGKPALRSVDYRPVLARVRELRGERAPAR